MRNTLLLVVSLVALLASSSAGQTRLAPLTVVTDVDYQRYGGMWFEISRLPNPRNRCATDVTSSYTLRDDGLLEVRNSCRKDNGDVLEATGVARRASGHPPSSLQIRYGPAFLGFLPGVWIDYQIIDLGDQYQYAVVGTPDRSSLRILARTPRMDPSLYRELVERARAQGFDVDALVLTTHPWT
ncbi:MAG: lipocalin family protein [Vicinamibacterales bacterium]